MANPQHQGRIVCKDQSEMVEIVAKLTEKGVLFDAMMSDGEWTIFIQG